MKKIILSLALVATGVVAFAQKPTAGSITTEIGLAGLLGAPANPVTLNIPQAMLRARYFLSDNLAARVHFGFGSGSTTTKNQSVQPLPPLPPVPVIVAESKTTTTGFGVALGIEYHLAGTDKLSPYVGAEVGFGSGSTKVENTNSSNFAGTATATGDAFKTSGGANNTLAINAMLGADYYITEKVYIGAELGIGLFRSATLGESTTESTVAAVGGNPAVTTTTKTQDAKGSSFGIFPNAIGQVRIGIILN